MWPPRACPCSNWSPHSLQTKIPHLLLSASSDSESSGSGVAFLFFSTFCFWSGFTGSGSYFGLSYKLDTCDEFDFDSETDGGAASLYLHMILLIWAESVNACVLCCWGKPLLFISSRKAAVLFKMLKTSGLSEDDTTSRLACLMRKLLGGSKRIGSSSNCCLGV